MALLPLLPSLLLPLPPLPRLLLLPSLLPLPPLLRLLLLPLLLLLMLPLLQLLQLLLLLLPLPLTLPLPPNATSWRATTATTVEKEAASKPIIRAAYAHACGCAARKAASRDHRQAHPSSLDRPRAHGVQCVYTLSRPRLSSCDDDERALRFGRVHNNARACTCERARARDTCAHERLVSHTPIDRRGVHRTRLSLLRRRRPSLKSPSGVLPACRRKRRARACSSCRRAYATTYVRHTDGVDDHHHRH